MEKIAKYAKIYGEREPQVNHGVEMERLGELTLEQRSACPGHSASRTGKAEEDGDGAGSLEEIIGDREVEQRQCAGQPEAPDICQQLSPQGM